MFKAIVSYWKSLPPIYQIIIIVILAIIIIWAVNHFKDQLKSLFQSRKVDYQEGENALNQGYNISKGKQYIQNIASEIYSDIYDTPVEPSWIGVPYAKHDLTPYKLALQLSDSDLLYLADYYDKYITKGTSLFKDMDSEYYIGDVSSYANDLKARLSKIGKR